MTTPIFSFFDSDLDTEMTDYDVDTESSSDTDNESLEDDDANGIIRRFYQSNTEYDADLESDDEGYLVYDESQNMMEIDIMDVDSNGEGRDGDTEAEIGESDTDADAYSENFSSGVEDDEDDDDKDDWSAKSGINAHTKSPKTAVGKTRGKGPLSLNDPKNPPTDIDTAYWTKKIMRKRANGEKRQVVWSSNISVANMSHEAYRHPRPMEVLITMLQQVKLLDFARYGSIIGDDVAAFALRMKALFRPEAWAVFESRKYSRDA
jgi:hypothetical protein